jgi:hypothetical protein
MRAGRLAFIEFSHAYTGSAGTTSDRDEDVSRPPRSAVRLQVWGLTSADQEHAVHRAGQGWGRNDWDFVATERLCGPTCPLDLKDGKAIAADTGYGWAYIVYPAGRP